VVAAAHDLVTGSEGLTVLVHDYVEYWAHRAPERECVGDGTRTLTYAQVDEQADRFAHLLADLGVGDGDRFGVLAKNCLEWAPIYAGAFKAGAIPVPLNYRHHPREWLHPMTDSGSTVFIAQSQYAAGVDGIRAELPDVHHFVLLDGLDGTDGLDETGWASYPKLLAAAPAQRIGRHIDPDHTLYLMYTSGTTGKPKGAVLTHRAADANLTQIRTALSLHHTTRNLLTSPMFHTASAVNLFAGWAAGLTAYMIIDFDPDGCARFIDDEKITMVSLAPAMIQAMLVSSTALRERRFEALRTVLYGASAINEQTLRDILEIFGGVERPADFYQAYGQTEATALLTMLGPEDHRRALDGDASLLRSAGRPVVGVELKVVDADGADCPTGAVGEILARGPQVMSGYWNLPEASEQALAGGWLHTGDAGYFDDDGYLFISDRVKDMIVSGAENVFPKEIEDVLYQLDGVAEAAVIGVPSERWGETVKAVVVPRPGVTLTEDEVITWCRGRLAGYKCPRSVDLVEELPRNAAGKVLKRVLREPYWHGSVRQVG
jgi:acyl-CoA synthetase (AMP-forming)/AMP-acid ligase II